MANFNEKKIFQTSIVLTYIFISNCFNISSALDPTDVKTVEDQDSKICIVLSDKCNKDSYLSTDQLKEINPSANNKQIQYIYNLQAKYYALFKKEYLLYKDSLDLPNVSKCVFFEWKVNSANGFLVDDSERIIKSSGVESLDKFCIDLIKQCSPFDGLITDIPGGKYNEITIRLLFNREVCKVINSKSVIVK